MIIEVASLEEEEPEPIYQNVNPTPKSEVEKRLRDMRARAHGGTFKPEEADGDTEIYEGSSMTDFGSEIFLEEARETVLSQDS